MLTSTPDNGDVLTSTAGFVPLAWRVDSAASPVSLRSCVFVGDGEGDRDLLIQDFRARVETDLATEGALRSMPGIDPSFTFWPSSARSWDDGSGPMANLGMVDGVLGSLCCLLEPSRLSDLLGDFRASSGPFLKEARRDAFPCIFAKTFSEKLRERLGLLVGVASTLASVGSCV